LSRETVALSSSHGPAASYRLHRTVPADEGAPATFRPLANAGRVYARPIRALACHVVGRCAMSVAMPQDAG
jgi:hypothetical protein